MRAATEHPDLDLLTTQEASVALRNAVSVSTLNRWRCEGCGPVFVKVGGRVYYRPQDLVTWLDQRTRQSTAQG